jgi:uncharacterized membrane protein YdjX (TVP38/TMEM64 family)
VDRPTLGALLFGVIIVVAPAFLFSPLGDWLSIDKLKESRDLLQYLVETRPVLCAAGFFLLCVVATAACFPAAPVLGITAGALFGLWPGLLLVLVASSIGSTIAFLDSRYLLREWVKRRFARRIGPIDRGMERHGALYLLMLRFNPIVPYWLVNLAMGVTAIGLKTYVALTPAGLMPATFLYVNAGTQLATIDSARDVFSPGVLLALLLLSLFPLVVRLAGALVGRQRG